MVKLSTFFHFPMNLLCFPLYYYCCALFPFGHTWKIYPNAYLFIAISASSSMWPVPSFYDLHCCMFKIIQCDCFPKPNFSMEITDLYILVSALSTSPTKTFMSLLSCSLEDVFHGHHLLQNCSWIISLLDIDLSDSGLNFDNWNCIYWAVLFY